MHIGGKGKNDTHHFFNKTQNRILLLSFSSQNLPTTKNFWKNIPYPPSWILNPCASMHESERVFLRIRNLHLFASSFKFRS